MSCGSVRSPRPAGSRVSTKPRQIPFLYGARIEVVEVVKARDSIPACDQALGQVRTDESGRAGDKNVHQGSQ